MERNNTITYLKAVGIISMVAVHSMCSIPYSTQFLTTYCMPLFFISSGYCLKPNNLNTPKRFFQKRITGLYIPFIKWSIIFTLFHNLFLHLHIYDVSYEGSELMTWKEALSTIWVIVSQMRCAPQLLGGYWFLNALFFGSILAWIMLRNIKKTYFQIASASAILALVHFTGFHITFLNLNERAFVAMWFIVVGFFLKQQQIKPLPLWGTICSFIASFICMFFWDYRYDRLSFANNDIFLHIIVATLCVWSIYSILTHWKETTSTLSRIMRFIGENTITILTWHLLFFKIVSFAIINIYSIPFNRLAEYPVIAEYTAQGWWIAYMFVAISTSCLVAYLNQKIKLTLRPANDKD